MPDPQDKFIDELDAAELPLAGTENLIISQEDFTRKISIDDLASQLPGGGGSVNWVSVPSSASDSGSPGDIAADSEFLYICITTDTWLRTPIVTWS